MKVVSLLLGVIMLFTTLTAGGAQVRAADETSPAFDHCLRVPGQASCRPAVRVIAAAEEFDAAAGDVYGGVDAGNGGGNDLSSPDFWQEVLAAIVRAGLVELARQVAVAVIGGAQEQSDLEAVIRDDVFDPGR